LEDDEEDPKPILTQASLTGIPTPAPTTPAALDSDSIPSNAIEMVNAAPGHAEEGLGDLGNSGMEVHLPSERDAGVAVDGEAKDEGLVMGEMEPPAEAMEVDGEHGAGPPEVSNECIMP
jgi:hypothetical protein